MINSYRRHSANNERRDNEIFGVFWVKSHKGNSVRIPGVVGYLQKTALDIKEGQPFFGDNSDVGKKGKKWSHWSFRKQEIGQAIPPII